VRDELLEQDAQAAEDASAVVKVRTVLLEQDGALQKAREDMAAVRVAAAEFKRELASAWTQLQQDCATLEGARSWQSHAEEKAKEVEQLRTSLTDKVASLASTKEQLQQERDARQQAEAQLQQERIALAESRAALERERLAREEAQGLLQQERAAHEGAQATLNQRDEEVSWLNGEMNQLSVSHEDLREAVEEQEGTILVLQQASETTRAALETEKKKVEGESPLSAFRLSAWFVWDLLPIFVFRLWFSGLRTTLGNSTTQAQAVQMAYNSSQQELEELRAAALEACQGSKRARCRPGARWRVAFAPSAGTLPSACTAPFTWVSRRPSAWWLPTTRSTSRPFLRAMSFLSASTTRWR
jgi:myosin heavy subunit